MDDSDVGGRVGVFVVRRVFLPERSRESFTVIGPVLRPVAVVDEYLAWLTDCERSPNSVEGYARDLRGFWGFLAERGLSSDQVGVSELAEFAAGARRRLRTWSCWPRSRRACRRGRSTGCFRAWSASTSFSPGVGRRWRWIWS
jgi:Phage integrase, N-terminal SAM-like domain